MSRATRAFSDRVAQATRRALEYQPGDPPPRLLVGISGGPDSSALLLALADRASRNGWSLSAAHVDHGIAAPALRERFRAAAAAIAERAGAPLRVCRVDAPAEAGRGGGGIEAAARRLRYAALRDAAIATTSQAIVVGHTMDDQAESVLLHVLRGSGLDGLAGMAPRGALPLPPLSGEARGAAAAGAVDLVRPLLGLRRSETAAFCRALGVNPVQDPDNLDPRRTRARLRTDVLPALLAINPRIIERLAALASAAARDREALDGLSAALAVELADPLPGGGLVLSRRALRAQPAALGVRVLRRLVAGLGAPAPDAERSAALARLLERGGHRVELEGRLVAEARGDRLWLRCDPLAKTERMC